MGETIYEGYSPYSHQLAVHRQLNYAYRSGRTYVVKARRQVGKSIMIEQELLRFAISYSSTTNACVSPTLSQARKVFQDIIDCIYDSGILKKKNETLLEMELVNGSRIFFKSAEQRDSLRGFTISGLLCIDEAAYIPDDIFNMVLPWTNVHKAPILICSTPKFKEGFYWSYWNLGLDEENTNIISIDFNDFDTSMLLDAERLEEYRRMLPRSQFLTEYLGEFLDSDGIVFDGFKECVGKGDVDGGLVMGIDWGTGGGADSTSISILNSKCQQVQHYNFNDKNTTQQIDFITNLIKTLRPILVVPELNSIGLPFTELLKQKNPYTKIEGVTTTNTTKTEMIQHLQVAFENRAITILDDERQLRELSMYECQFNPRTKTVTYNAPQGHHDDDVMSLALSLRAYEMRNKRGKYNIR